MSDHHVEAGHQLPTGHMCYCQKPWLHHSEAAAPYDVNHRLFVWQKSQKVGVPLQGGVMLHGWHLSRHHCFQLAPQLDNRGWEDNRMCWYSSSECGDSLSKHGNAIGSADNKGWEDNSMCWYSLSECDDSLSQHGNTLGSANYIILWDFCGFLECHFYVTEKHKTISTSSLTAIFLFTGQTTMIWQQRPCQKQKLMGHQCSPQQLQVI